MSEPVRIETANGVATVTLDRPEARNALDEATKVALRDGLAAVGADHTVRAVVLTGAGSAFCVGQDLREHAANLRDRSIEQVPDHYAPIAHSLLTMPKPVIAAVNGIAAGAGASIAFACDLRLVADTAGFNLAFTAIGLSCDTGSSWTLPRLVGQAKARELLLMPTTVDAQEALALALATRVVPAADLAAEAAALAARLASGPTMAYAAVKEALTYAAAHSFEESLVREAELMARTGGSADHRDAVEGFLAKEPPAFTGR
jgi:2-(1,2-epoxy-1,2-dihydrophenyl)acetyl-CoA isomerase